MATMLRTDDTRPLRGANMPSTAAAGRKTAILRRIVNFLSTWDQKQKDREIERLLARSGGRFTDELERRMMQRAMASDWCVHR
jgi:hypothetical protein